MGLWALHPDHAPRRSARPGACDEGRPLKGSALDFVLFVSHCIGTAVTKRCPLSYRRVTDAAMGPEQAPGAGPEDSHVPSTPPHGL